MFLHSPQELNFLTNIWQWQIYTTFSKRWNYVITTWFKCSKWCNFYEILLIFRHTGPFTTFMCFWEVQKIVSFVVGIWTDLGGIELVYCYVYCIFIITMTTMICDDLYIREMSACRPEHRPTFKELVEIMSKPLWARLVPIVDFDSALLMIRTCFMFHFRLQLCYYQCYSVNEYSCWSVGYLSVSRIRRKLWTNFREFFGCAKIGKDGVDVMIMYPRIWGTFSSLFVTFSTLRGCVKPCTHSRQNWLATVDFVEVDRIDCAVNCVDRTVDFVHSVDSVDSTGDKKSKSILSPVCTRPKTVSAVSWTLGDVGVASYGAPGHVPLDFQLVFTAQCTLVHMRGLGIACRLSVRLSVCDVGDLWSHRLEILETNCTHN